jgi:hypothetical protein
MSRKTALSTIRVVMSARSRFRPSTTNSYVVPWLIVPAKSPSSCWHRATIVFSTENRWPRATQRSAFAFVKR